MGTLNERTLRHSKIEGEMQERCAVELVDSTAFLQCRNPKQGRTCCIWLQLTWCAGLCLKYASLGKRCVSHWIFCWIIFQSEGLWSTLIGFLGYGYKLDNQHLLYMTLHLSLFIGIAVLYCKRVDSAAVLASNQEQSTRRSDWLLLLRFLRRCCCQLDC